MLAKLVKRGRIMSSGPAIAIRESMQEMNIGLWDFALRLYKAPDVADACLALQERNGVDVPVLLFAAWLKQSSIALSPAKTVQIIGLVDEWRDEVVAPLRAIRQRMKTGPKPGPDKHTETLRDAVKAAELSAERIELMELETAGLALATISDDSNRSTDENLALVVRYYHGSTLDSKARKSIAVVERALIGL
jgi:uncharacterized protein (TIGR02444 family)